MIWETLLGAALEASLGLLAEAGFGEEVRALKDRWTRQDEKARQAAFDRAFQRAKDSIDDESLRPLLEHRPFQEAVVAGLLYPASGFDWRAAIADWEDKLPRSYIPSLRRFFSTLEITLLSDETWGPILERYQAMRFRQDVMKALEERELDVSQRRVVSMVNAELRGSGAIAQGDSAVAAGASGMAIGGDVERAVQIVIQELTVQQAPSSTVGPQPDDLREHYLTDLARAANCLPWTIVEQEYAHPDHGEAMGLAEVYTALDTTELERVEREEELRRFLAQVARDEIRRIPAQTMVNQETRLVILGDPGSGKSTFVKHLAYTLAQAGLGDDPDLWLKRMEPWDHNVCLPVWVELRALAAYAEEEETDGRQLLLGYLHEQLRQEELEAFWPLLNEEIRSKKGKRSGIRETDEPLLVLLDGLDEVPSDLRGEIVGAVQDFADHYRQHRYVVTCRPYAYVGQPCQLQRFREVTLAPFNEEQIDHFVETWYEQLAQRDRLSSKKAKTQAAQMQRAVRRGDLQGLAQRPLLLTVMTLLHTFRGQLPQDRTELYTDAVDLLLRRWEGRIGEEEGILEQLDIPGLKMSDLEAGLYNVAYRAHTEAGASDDGDGAATADVDEGILQKWLKPYLGGDWNKADEFVAYIRERAGLLIRHKTDAYTFPHRTFQEFMAACHLVGMEDYPGQASRLVRDDLTRWREVFVLAAGHAARTHRLVQALSAVNALCPEGPKRMKRVGEPDAAAYRRAQLAGESLLEIGMIGVRREETGRAILARVWDWMMTAMRADDVLEAQERAEAGDVLAKLGDPRFRADAWHLPDEPLLGFVEVPKGPFLMGSDEVQDKMARDNEQPQHELLLPTYYIARYPVTVAQFRAFVEDSDFQPGDADSLRGVDNHSVVWVSWHEALAYCKWLTQKLREWEKTPEPLATLLREAGWVITLPSEAEWEKAARGSEDSRRYPWGEDTDPNRANYEDTGIGTTSAVGCFPGGASPYGVEDLSGNVWECTRSLWGKDKDSQWGKDWKKPDFGHPYDPKDGRENLEAGDDFLRVVRGGAFYYAAADARCAARRDWYTRYRDGGDGGFRVVVAPFSQSVDL